MAAKKTPTRQPSQADLLRLGAGVAGVKAQTNPKAWKSFVKSTHKQGYSVVDTVNGVPAPLRGRTQEYLKKTAASQIAQAYAPIDKSLNDSESRVKAWDDKRKTDNKAYQQWVVDQTANLSVAGRAADQAVADRQKVLLDDLKTTTAAAAPQAQANLQGMQGVVSDFSQSSAVAGVGDAAAKNAALVNSAAQGTADLHKLSEGTRQLTDQAAMLGAQAMDGRRTADTSKALSDILDKRTSANIQRAADYLKSYGDLKATELTKAQGNRDSSMAAEQLHLGQDKLTSADLNARAGRKVQYSGQRKTATTAADQLEQTKKDKAKQRAIDKARIRLDQKKADLNSDGTVDAKDYKLKKQIDAENTTGKSTTGVRGKTLTPDQQNKYVGGIKTAQGIITDLNKKPPKGATVRQVLRRRGYSDNIIDLGEDLRKNGGKLSPRGRAKAKALGIDPAALEA